MALVERSGSLASCRVTIYRTKHGEDRHRSLHISSEMPTRCSRRESHERKNVHGCKTMSIHTRTVHEYAFDRSRARKGKEAKLQKCQKRKQTKKIERKRKEKKRKRKKNEMGSPYDCVSARAPKTICEKETRCLQTDS